MMLGGDSESFTGSIEQAKARLLRRFRNTFELENFVVIETADDDYLKTYDPGFLTDSISD